LRGPKSTKTIIDNAQVLEGEGLKLFFMLCPIGNKRNSLGGFGLQLFSRFAIKPIKT
jgi:hypothetical protein